MTELRKAAKQGGLGRAGGRFRLGRATVAYTQFMRQAEADGQPATDFSVYLSLYSLMIIATRHRRAVRTVSLGLGRQLSK